MKPYLLERVSSPFMSDRCRTICYELGDNGFFKHGSLYINVNCITGSIELGIENGRMIPLYKNQWLPHTAPACKRKIKGIINEQFIIAVEAALVRIESERLKSIEDANYRNKLCEDL